MCYKVKFCGHFRSKKYCFYPKMGTTSTIVFSSGGMATDRHHVFCWFVNPKPAKRDRPARAGFVLFTNAVLRILSYALKYINFHLYIFICLQLVNIFLFKLFDRAHHHFPPIFVVYPVLGFVCIVVFFNVFSNPLFVRENIFFTSTCHPLHPADQLTSPS